MTTSTGTGLLNDKVVLILGASSGIGADAARVFCEEGAELMLAARSTDRLAELTDTLNQQGHRVDYQACDIANAADVQAIVDTTVSRHGRIDGAFNNAGVSQGGHRLIDLTEDQYDEVMSINLRGIWLALRAQIRAMLQAGQPGAIVNTSSVGGMRGGPNLGAYPATKRGVIALTTIAAHEYGANGIRINAIAPGTTDTPMIAAWKQREPNIAERLNAITPLGRGAEPREVAQAAAWLLSDRASYITGAVLPVDGGMTA